MTIKLINFFCRSASMKNEHRAPSAHTDLTVSIRKYGDVQILITSFLLVSDESSLSSRNFVLLKNALIWARVKKNHPGRSRAKRKIRRASVGEAERKCEIIFWNVSHPCHPCFIPNFSIKKIGDEKSLDHLYTIPRFRWNTPDFREFIIKKILQSSGREKYANEK